MSVGTKTVELRKIADDELTNRLVEMKEELFNLRFQSATGQLESHGRLKAVRRDIARIYTILRERELGITELESDLESDGDVSAPEKEEGAE
jgi:large subunit ribosomal protein L29